MSQEPQQPGERQDHGKEQARFRKEPGGQARAEGGTDHETGFLGDLFEGVGHMHGRRVLTEQIAPPGSHQRASRGGRGLTEVGDHQRPGGGTGIRLDGQGGKGRAGEKGTGQGDAPLADSLKLFEEGATLITACTKQLDVAEQKVGKLRKGPDGEPEELPFEEAGE